jgi:hypothetical protein
MLEVAILIGGVAQRGLGTIVGLARDGGATRLCVPAAVPAIFEHMLDRVGERPGRQIFVWQEAKLHHSLNEKIADRLRLNAVVFLETLGELATSNSMAYSALPRGRPEGDCAGLNGGRRPLHSSKRTSRCRYRRPQNARQALQSLQNRLFDTGRLSAKPSEPLENQ